MKPNLLILTIALAFATGVARAEIQPAARELAKSVNDKLGSARTIRLTATHSLDPALGVGAAHDKGPLQITVKRPNQFYVIQRAGAETREIAFDGKSLSLMRPGLKHHALESLKAGSISQFADRADDRFGFRPPVAELLAEDLASQLFLNVTSAKVTGQESVGGIRCERLRFEQPGITGDLWVGLNDKLPRRYRLTFTGIPKSPQWDLRLTKWELNVPVDARLFSKRAAADSQKLKMHKSS